MKKILVFLLALTLTIGLCACGAQDFVKEIDPADETVDTAALSANADKASAYIENIVDVTKMTSQTDDQGTAIQKNWSYEEAPDGVDFPMEITIDGDPITIKETKISEIKALGFDVEIGKEYETVQPQSNYSFSITKDSKSAAVSVDNNTDQPQNIDDMPVSGFQGSFNEFSLDFTYSGLNGESALKDVIAAIGAPNDLSLTADSFGTKIDVNYLFEGTEGGFQTSENLTVSLAYNAENNTAAVSDISIHTFVYTEAADAAE